MDLEDRIERLEDRMSVLNRGGSQHSAAIWEMREELSYLRMEQRLESTSDKEDDMETKEEKSSFMHRLLSWVKPDKKNKHIWD